MENSVKLIWVTPNAEQIIGYCARVSNPANQENTDVSKLLSYCIKNKHWSIFEMANMCVEIETSRAISAQILRHRSFSFQEFSQRYAESIGIIPPDVRRQDTKNRQNSIDDIPDETAAWWNNATSELFDHSQAIYKEAIQKGIAKECARFVLPMSTKTRLYMNGSIRSWLHYIELRCANGTQKEHQEIALKIRDIVKQNFPVISTALAW